VIITDFMRVYMLLLVESLDFIKYPVNLTFDFNQHLVNLNPVNLNFDFIKHLVNLNFKLTFFYLIFH